MHSRGDRHRNGAGVGVCQRSHGHRGNLGRRFGHNDHDLPVRRIFPQLLSKSRSASMQKARRTAPPTPDAEG